MQKVGAARVLGRLAIAHFRIAHIPDPSSLIPDPQSLIPSDDIIGDLGSGQQVLANWGLRVADVNLTMGNLLDIVRQQARAYRR